MRTYMQIGIVAGCLFASACVSSSLDLNYTERRPERADHEILATGEVVQLAAPLVESYSIAGDRYLARVVLDQQAQVGEWRGSVIKLHYDKYGLWFDAPELGDRLTFVFTAGGEFVNVFPESLPRGE